MISNVFFEYCPYRAWFECSKMMSVLIGRSELQSLIALNETSEMCASRTVDYEAVTLSFGD